MTTRENLKQVLEKLPDDRVKQVLEFAEFLASHGESLDWQGFGREQFARAYGPNEPEYTLADLKSGGKQ